MPASQPPQSSLPMLGAAPAARTGGPVLWAIGFRPFFLLAALHGALMVPLWVFWVLPGGSLSAPLPPLTWHVHEMLFGYTVAVVAGFLLTAVQNWTGRPTARGPALQLLVGLWLLGRMACLFGGAWPTLAAAVDLSFLPALAFFVGRPIVATRSRRNLIFVAALLLLAGMNALFHFGPSPARGALPGPSQVALDLIALMILVMGGRIIGPFTRNALGREPRPATPIDRVGVALLPCVVLLDLVGSQAILLGGTLIAAGGINLLRLWGWNGSRTLTRPILWALHGAWLSVTLSLVSRGLHLLGVLDGLPLAASLSVHLLTVGGIGLATLGMMARVSLGHTGRPLQLPRAAAVAIHGMALSLLSRVALPALTPSGYTAGLHLSAGLWCVAFLLFLWAYLPVLTRPRADGKPG